MAEVQNKSDSVGSEIAVRKSTDPSAIVELEQILRGTGNPLLDQEIVDDPEEISRAIIAELLDAESDEELASFGETLGWRTLAVPRKEAVERGGGVPMLLHYFRWRPSKYDDSKVFLIVSATRMDTGERVTLTTGSGNVLAQLVNMAKRDTLEDNPWVLVQKDTETEAGFFPLFLVAPPAKKREQASG